MVIVDANQTVVDDGNITVAQRWFDAEVNKPATSLRAYYRQRSSDRVAGNTHVGAPYGLCELGSRWNKFAFDRTDVYKVVTITADPRDRVFTFVIDNLLRTDATSFQGKPFDLKSVSSEWLICSVGEAVGASITVRANDDSWHAPARCSSLPSNQALHSNHSITLQNQHGARVMSAGFGIEDVIGSHHASGACCGCEAIVHLVQ
jgi:hypothetical protein